MHEMVCPLICSGYCMEIQVPKAKAFKMQFRLFSWL